MKLQTSRVTYFVFIADFDFDDGFVRSDYSSHPGDWDDEYSTVTRSDRVSCPAFANFNDGNCGTTGDGAGSRAD